jgi:hypothetical protein
MTRALGMALALAGVTACGETDRPTAPVDGETDPLALHVSSDRDDDRRLHSDHVEARVVFTAIKARVRRCEGEEGPYAETDHTFFGISTGDPRLSGRVELRVHDIFNIAEGLGPQRAAIRITEGGRRKVEGEYAAWGPADIVQGTITGRVSDDGGGPEPTSGDGTLIANWRVTYHENGAVTAELGGLTTDARLPAGVWTGKCRGPFTESDVELPPPGAATLSKAHALPHWRSGR